MKLKTHTRVYTNRNTIVYKYTELDKIATDEIKSLEDDINSLKVKVKDLTQERYKLISELETANSKYNELQETMNNIELKEFNESELIKKEN